MKATAQQSCSSSTSSLIDILILSTPPPAPALARTVANLNCILAATVGQMHTGPALRSERRVASSVVSTDYDNCLAGLFQICLGIPYCKTPPQPLQWEVSLHIGKCGVRLSIAVAWAFHCKEQRRIAAVLQTCDREIELLTQKHNALQRQKKGLMQRLLTGRVRVKV
jgi:hypothetical protein